MSFNEVEFNYLGRCVEGFLFGIYSAVFAMHLKYDAIKRETDNAKPNIIFYALSSLYLLTMAVFATDIALAFNLDITVAYRTSVAADILFGFCDFIAQSILIHRCWIVWGCNKHVVIIPSILAFAYLVTWMTGISAVFIDQFGIDTKVWGFALALTSLTASMTVNALATGLIVLRISKVFRKVRSVATLEDKSFSIRDGNKLRSVTFVIIESGMTLFILQLARVAITATKLSTEADYDAFELIVAIHEILNGIAPTIIFVRVSLGLSFHNEESLVEAVGSLHFATDRPNSILEIESMDQDGHIGHDDSNPLSDMYQERRNDQSGGSDDIHCDTARYTGDDILQIKC